MRWLWDARVMSIPLIFLGVALYLLTVGEVIRRPRWHRDRPAVRVPLTSSVAVIWRRSFRGREYCSKERWRGASP
jgi:hypothetical protein